MRPLLVQNCHSNLPLLAPFDKITVCNLCNFMHSHTKRYRGEERQVQSHAFLPCCDSKTAVFEHAKNIDKIFIYNVLALKFPGGAN